MSGVALAVFLPFHFLLLSTAINGADAMDEYLTLAEMLPVKIAEWGLVTLLAAHLFFGIRVLLLEFTHWPRRINRYAAWIVPCTIATVLIATLFIIRVY